MNTLYSTTEKFICATFGEESTTTRHLKRTADWALALKPEIDEAFLIAAVSHDISRSEKSTKDWGTDYMRNPEYLTYHQDRGAEIIGEFLEKEGAPTELISRVKHLISKHEVGGDDDQNFLKDVDSLSFFENNVQHFLKNMLPKLGKSEIEEKFDWMFDRITSPKARELARPFYEEARIELRK